LPLDSVLPHHEYAVEGEHEIMALSIATGLFGIFVAWIAFQWRPQIREAIARNPLGALLREYWYNAWGFDWLYRLVFVRPYLWFTSVNANDAVETGIQAIPVAFKRLHGSLAASQTGQIRWYAMAMAAGAVVIVGAAVLL